MKSRFKFQLSVVLVLSCTFQFPLAHARYYDAAVGRFITPDSIVPSAGDPQSFNRYAYVRNNPLIYDDPSGNNPIVIGAVVGALWGAYQGYQLSKSKGHNWGDWQTYAYIQGGGMIGAASGGVAGSIYSPGGPFAGTMSIIAGSLTNSAGMSFMSKGQTSGAVSVGFASVNGNSGEWGYLFGPGNDDLENVMYGFGALANLQDVFAGFNGTNVTVNSASTKKPHDWWGHSSITNDNESINISVGPATPGKKGALKIMAGDGNWDNYSADASTWKMPINNINSKILTNLTQRTQNGNGLMFGRLNWNLAGFSCVNHASRALWLSGVPTLPINFHPLVLNTQLFIRQNGIASNPYAVNQE